MPNTRSKKSEFIENKRKRKPNPKWDDFDTSGGDFFASATPPRKLKLSPKEEQVHLPMKLGIDDLLPENYISSHLDKLDWFTVKPVDVLKQVSGGKGVFAEMRIPSERCIGEYTGKIFKSKSFQKYLKQQPGGDSAYSLAVDSDEETIIDASEKGNFTRYINYSDSQANVAFERGYFKGKSIIKVVTTKVISKGQQLLIDYNTYDEKINPLYLFLNPSDGFHSAAEFYQLHQDYYFLTRVPKHLPLFNRLKNERIEAILIGQCVLNGDLLSKHSDKISKLAASTVDFPFLKKTKEKELYEYYELDTFTPLMLASYLGQAENVLWCIQNGANVDQQQNQSGLSPLFCALEGYKIAKPSAKANYMCILQSLIEGRVNVSTHDRLDNSFLHKALAILTAEDFSMLMSLLRLEQSICIEDLFLFINQEDNDIFQSCLYMKYFEQAKALLDCYPNYLEKYYIHPNEDREQYQQTLCDIITRYSKAEILVLEDLLGARAKKYALPPAIEEASQVPHRLRADTHGMFKPRVEQTEAYNENIDERNAGSDHTYSSLGAITKG